MGYFHRSSPNKDHGYSPAEGNFAPLADTHRSSTDSMGKVASFFRRGGSVHLCTPIPRLILVGCALKASCQIQAGSTDELDTRVGRVLLGGQVER